MENVQECNILLKISFPTYLYSSANYYCLSQDCDENLNIKLIYNCTFYGKIKFDDTKIFELFLCTYDDEGV